MSTPREKSRQGCPRARLEAAYAAMLAVTGANHHQGRLHDAKLAWQAEREGYEAAVIAELQKRPPPPLDYPSTEYWQDVVLPLRAKLDRVRREAKGPWAWADEVDALYALAAAEVDYEAICGQPRKCRRFRAISDGVIWTGKKKLIDGELVPVVEKVSDVKE